MIPAGNVALRVKPVIAGIEGKYQARPKAVLILIDKECAVGIEVRKRLRAQDRRVHRGEKVARRNTMAVRRLHSDLYHARGLLCTRKKRSQFLIERLEVRGARRGTVRRKREHERLVG